MDKHNWLSNRQSARIAQGVTLENSAINHGTEVRITSFVSG